MPVFAIVTQNGSINISTVTVTGICKMVYTEFSVRLYPLPGELLPISAFILLALLRITGIKWAKARVGKMVTMQ